MTIRVIIFLYLVNSVSAQTWDVSDYYGVATIKAPVELPYSGGPIPHASWKVTGPLGEVGWQQFSNGNVGISQPARSASKLSLSYNGAGNLVRISSECTPSGAYYAKSYTQTTLTAGEIVVPRHIGEGAVSSNVTDGTNYYVVASGAGFCGAGSAFDQSFLVSTTPGGSAITVTDRGSGGSNSFAYDWTIQGAVWDGSTGLRIHSTFVNGDPVRFQCAENGSGTCTLPTGLSAGTTYYLKTNGTDLYLVYSDHALSSAVNVTGAGSGINEVISYWVYTLTNSASAGIAVTNPVVISSGTTYTDITNGLTGFRIANPCNANWGSIQGINTSNGWVAARAPNLLYTATGTTFPQTTPVSSLSCTLNWIERGPLKTEVQVTYTSGGNGLDGQPGVYIADIVLYADSRSVI